MLGDMFVGLYLYGSRATGDFDPETSDLDFLVVTLGEIPPEKIPQLEAVHRHLAASGRKWAEALEGAYMPLNSLRRYNASDPPRPRVNDRQFYMAQQGTDWILDLHVLREHPMTIAGPALLPWIDPVSAEDIREAVRKNLEAWWAQMLSDPVRLTSDAHQAFAILTMCRSLFILRTGTRATKRGAANWALGVLPDRWRPIVRKAIAWPNAKLDAKDEALSLIDYVVTAFRTNDGSMS